MASSRKARAIGFNHVALEVEDIDEALACDPWGNRIEIVGYQNIQFTKAPNVLRGMKLEHLRKTDSAIRELAEKGMDPQPSA